MKQMKSIIKSIIVRIAHMHTHMQQSLHPTIRNMFSVYHHILNWIAVGVTVWYFAVTFVYQTSTLSVMIVILSIIMTCALIALMIIPFISYALAQVIKYAPLLSPILLFDTHLYDASSILHISTQMSVILVMFGLINVYTYLYHNPSTYSNAGVIILNMLERIRYSNKSNIGETIRKTFNDACNRKQN